MNLTVGALRKQLEGVDDDVHVYLGRESPPGVRHFSLAFETVEKELGEQIPFVVLTEKPHGP